MKKRVSKNVQVPARVPQYEGYTNTKRAKRK